VRQELQAGTLSRLSIDDPLLGGPVGVSMRENNAMTDAQRNLILSLDAVASETPQSILTSER
jgi:LysR family pca operon transcriptional activator